MSVLPSASLLEELRGIVGADGVIDSADRLLAYESDALTAYRMPPSAVILPRNTAEVSEVLASLHREEILIVPRGAGTGLSGGALAKNGAVIVATARMNNILEMDVEGRVARVQPGVANVRLSEAARPHGLYYAPDPSSQTVCTLGGNVAENSGGPHCLKYGVTSRYVLGLTLVLSDGTVVPVGGAFQDRGDLDLVGTVVGSEGCLAFVSEIEVGLLPMPAGVRTLLAVFDHLEDAGRAVTDIISRGLLPAALEIMDQPAIEAVEASVYAAGYPTDAAAVLVVEFDGTEVGLDEEVEQAVLSCDEAGAREIRRAGSDAEREALWQGRKKSFGAMGRIAPDLLIQDATVPRSLLPQVLGTIRGIGDRYQLRIANVFHAGDGNLHPKILFDRREPNQLELVERASREIMQACVDAGGTITGEHGVGLDKRDYMPMVYSPEVLQAMAEVKQVFDPPGRLNRGKVLPEGVVPRPPADRKALFPLSSGPELKFAFATGERFCPNRPEQVQDVLRWAAHAGWSVVPVGSGLGLRSAGLPSRSFVRLGTEQLADIVDYEPADLTITVGAGMTLNGLARETAPHGQWLPVDSPGTGEETVGGVVAMGLGGLLGPSFGRPRDLVLGLTMVSGDGRILNLGGRVVKNVAGFDLVRMVVGSRGKLGMITGVTLRLYPRPAADRVLVASGDTIDELITPFLTLQRAPLIPAGLALIKEQDGPARLVVRLLGSDSGTAAEAIALQRLIPERGLLAVSSSDPVLGLIRAADVAGELSVRLSASPKWAKAVLDVVTREFGGLGTTVLEGNTGVVRWSGSLTDRSVGAVAASLQTAMSELGGVVRITSGPAETPAEPELSSRNDLAKQRLELDLQASFDPWHVLNSPPELA